MNGLFSDIRWELGKACYGLGLTWPNLFAGMALGLVFFVLFGLVPLAFL